MREILFRGFDIVGNKGWVYGDLVHNKKVTRNGLEPRVMVGGYEVDPESVGQYIGGISKANEEKLFEGDILEASVTFEGLIDKVGCISFIDGGFVYEMEKSQDGKRRYSHLGSFKIRKIGTKYENPELLDYE